MLNLFSYFRPIKKPPMPATPTYSPPTSQNPMEILRADTRDTRRPMNPLTGICPTHRTPRGYRHASPHGDRLRLGIAERHSDVPQSTAHYSLLTAHCGSHLGSSSWITYTDGKAVQHLHYLPWGEDFVDQRTNSFDGARHTFSAKERDSETGLSYFGSRYYSSDLSIWLSVDPMAHKYPSLSPYVYCENNPVMLVDPNGEGVLPTDDLKANSSVSTLFSYANNNSVFRKVMNRYYTNISSVYIHLAQLKRAGVPTGRNNIARTEPYWSTDNPVGRYGIERIIINSDILNSAGEIAGDLTFVFGSLLHEAIHAKFIDIQQYDNALSNYPGYKDFIVDRPQDGGQHNQMAVYNRQTLIDGMKEFDMQTGNSHTDEWYEAVSWNGLQGTKAWQTFSNDNPELANKYLKIITSEINKLGVTGK